MIEKLVYYKTIDGKKFASLELAEEYEKKNGPKIKLKNILNRIQIDRYSYVYNQVNIKSRIIDHIIKNRKQVIQILSEIE